MPGFPVVLKSSGGVPVTDTPGRPLATVASNGYGLPITLVASGGWPLSVEGAVVAPAFPATGFVAEGDSITAGVGTNFTYPSYPVLLGMLTGVGAINRGTGGDTLASMDTNYATDVAPSYNAATANTLLIQGGYNDIFQGLAGANATTIIAKITSIAGKARATGYKVVLVTMHKTTSTVGGDETLRSQYNSWVRANWATIADGLVDMDLAPAFQNPANTAILYDGLHLTDAGIEAYAEFVRSSLNIPRISNRVLNGNFALPLYNWRTICTEGDASAYVSVSGGVFTLLSDATHHRPTSIYTLTGLNPGQTYNIRFTSLSSSTAPSRVRVTTDPNGGATGGVYDSGTLNTSFVMSPFSGSFVASAATMYLSFGMDSAAESWNVQIANLSVAIPGTLGVNMLVNGYGLDSTGWTATNVTIATGQGTAAAQFRLTTTVASTGQHMSRNPAGIVAGSTYRFGGILRAGTAEGGVWIKALGSVVDVNTPTVSVGTDTPVSANVTADAAFLTLFGQYYSDFVGRTAFLEKMYIRQVY